MKRSNKLELVLLTSLLSLVVIACQLAPYTPYVIPDVAPDLDYQYEYPDDGASNDTFEPYNGAMLIADHMAANEFADIPSSAIEVIHSQLHIFYGHTSHGSQIVTGMEMLANEYPSMVFNTSSSTLSLQEVSEDLGGDGNVSWVETTRNLLDQPGNNINVVVWSWCGGVSDNTVEGIDDYLAAMEELESDYPLVNFVYMTGHLDGTGDAGNLRARNEQIRIYCRTNNKILFDFADIESYAPNGTFFPNGTDWCEWCVTWCETNTCATCDDCAHSVCFNCYRKGRAFWWLLARITGWS